jgi:hypothetical protein
MAGQGQRGSRDLERSSRLDSRTALVAAPSAGESGSEVITSTVSLPPAASPSPTPAPTPAPTPRAVSRLLQMKGMTPDEAANLTAFLYGLPTADLRWTISQLNELLFLRQMRQSGRFGYTDGGTNPVA